MIVLNVGNRTKEKLKPLLYQIVQLGNIALLDWIILC